MKRKIVMIAAMVLSIGCMAVPVAASENVATPAAIAAETGSILNYSPYCPDCDVLGVYQFQQPDGFGNTMVFRECPLCHLLFHHYG